METDSATKTIDVIFAIGDIQLRLDNCFELYTAKKIARCEDPCGS